jgi:hypothetical protein
MTMDNSITCDINNPHGLLFIFSKVLLFFRTWRLTPAMQLSVAKLIVTNSFLASRHPSYLQGSEQFSERVLKMGEKILYNLQKNIVESTISTAAGLEKESSYPAARRALPYYLHFI